MNLEKVNEVYKKLDRNLIVFKDDQTIVDLLTTWDKQGFIKFDEEKGISLIENLTTVKRTAGKKVTANKPLKTFKTENPTRLLSEDAFNKQKKEGKIIYTTSFNQVFGKRLVIRDKNNKIVAYVDVNDLAYHFYKERTNVKYIESKFINRENLKLDLTTVIKEKIGGKVFYYVPAQYTDKNGSVVEGYVRELDSKIKWRVPSYVTITDDKTKSIVLNEIKRRKNGGADYRLTTFPQKFKSATNVWFCEINDKLHYLVDYDGQKKYYRMN